MKRLETSMCWGISIRFLTRMGIFTFWPLWNVASQTPILKSWNGNPLESQLLTRWDYPGSDQQPRLSLELKSATYLPTISRLLPQHMHTCCVLSLITCQEPWMISPFVSTLHMHSSLNRFENHLLQVAIANRKDCFSSFRFRLQMQESWQIEVNILVWINSSMSSWALDSS